VDILQPFWVVWKILGDAERKRARFKLEKPPALSKYLIPVSGVTLSNNLKL
jgi:hypothetical protein